jgi:hypothetical protein
MRRVHEEAEVRLMGGYADGSRMAIIAVGGFLSGQFQKERLPAKNRGKT